MILNAFPARPAGNFLSPEGGYAHGFITLRPVEIPAKSILEQNWNIRDRLAICG
jgi:hypothetical protein